MHELEPDQGPYPLPVYCDSELGDDYADATSWTAQDYTLAYALDVSDNRVAEALVVEAVKDRDPELAARLRYDSELGCFFAYADDEADIRSLAVIVADLVAGIHPAAVPGDIWASPAAFRNWDVAELG